MNFNQTTAKVAAWNIAGFQRISEDRLARQVEGLALLDAEVVALIEVKPFSHMQALVDGLADMGAVYHSIMPAQNSDLNIGVLFKDGVEASNARFIENSDLGNPENRRALVVDMKVGKFDFVLVAVHLKSSRARASQQTRDEQCKVIGAWITEFLDNQQEDVVLLGDFNMIPGEDVSNFHHLGGDDLMNFVSSWDLQDRFSHILPAGRANLLDGFAISRRFSTEYIRGSLRLFPMHWTMDMGRERFRTNVSDHLPFVASFRIDKSRGG
ncbi:MAG: endonuclease/exonuclease/phosphatase family protein [Pseudomonadota bacterium]